MPVGINPTIELEPFATSPSEKYLPTAAQLIRIMLENDQWDNLLGFIVRVQSLGYTRDEIVCMFAVGALYLSKTQEHRGRYWFLMQCQRALLVLEQAGFDDEHITTFSEAFMASPSVALLDMHPVQC